MEFTTDELVTMVRFHGPANQKGGWFAMIPAAKGCTDAEKVRQLLCLKRPPTHYSIVEIPAGIRIRKVGVRKQPEWGCPNDGGTQFEVLEEGDVGNIFYSQERTIEQWSREMLP